MINMMEQYSNNLEGLVGQRTQEVHEEKRRSDNLLYKMLPKSVYGLKSTFTTLANRLFHGFSN